MSESFVTAERAHQAHQAIRLWRVLDGFPNSVVSAELTLTLDRLADQGGRNLAGGVAQATAATYPNHATFVTGASTLEHGIIANSVFGDGRWIAAEKAGLAKVTIFDACQAEGCTSAAVVGDHKLIGVCNATVANSHWPPQGQVPAEAVLSEGGYLADPEVLTAVGALDLDHLYFLFVQLDEVGYGSVRPDAALGQVPSVGWGTRPEQI